MIKKIKYHTIVKKSQQRRDACVHTGMILITPSVPKYKHKFVGKSECI
jgi:hypothetical protein